MRSAYNAVLTESETKVTTTPSHHLPTLSPHAESTLLTHVPLARALKNRLPQSVLRP